MSEFLRFMDELREKRAFHLEIYYSKTMDWNINVWLKGMASDYPASDCDGDDAIVCCEQDIDMELCFAKAHVAVKEWLTEHNGGY